MCGFYGISGVIEKAVTHELDGTAIAQGGDLRVKRKLIEHLEVVLCRDLVDVAAAEQRMTHNRVVVGGRDERQPVDPRGVVAQGIDEVVADRRGCTLLVRNALFRRVTLAAREHVRDLGELDEDWGMSEVRWQKALDAYHEQHEEILTDGDARSAAMFSIDESDEKTDHVWHVHQIFADEDGDHDFGIMGDVDLDATQDGGEVIFKNYRVGFIEDLLED